MNETDVRIRTLRRDGAVSEEPLDEDFQEPTGPYRRQDDELILPAQVVFEKHEKNMTLFNGDQKLVVGRLVFKTQKLNDKLKAEGIVALQNGDLITSISRDLNGVLQDVEYLIFEVRPTAWLRGVPLTTTAYFGQNTDEIAGLAQVR